MGFTYADIYDTGLEETAASPESWGVLIFLFAMAYLLKKFYKVEAGQVFSLMFFFLLFYGACSNLRAIISGGPEVYTVIILIFCTLGALSMLGKEFGEV